MAHELWNAFNRELGNRAEARAPSGVRGTFERFGWSTRDVAERFGVSERTARRWRQQDRVPERRREDFQREARSAAAARQRDRIRRRGLKGMNVNGTYYVNGDPKYRYRTGPGSPVRIIDGNKISAATMRDAFKAAEDGRLDDAERLLSNGLAEAYGMHGPGGGEGGATLDWEEVEGLDFDIG